MRLLKLAVYPASLVLFAIALTAFAAAVLTTRKQAPAPREPVMDPMPITETNAANIAADIAAMKGGGTLILPTNITGAVSGTITVNNANITVYCYPGTIVSTTGTPDANMWQVQANNFQMEGCTMNYGGRGSLMFIGSVAGVTNTTIRHTRFLGGPLRFGQKVRNLAVDDFEGSYIQGDNDASGIRIVNSVFDFTGQVSGVQLHSTTANTRIAKVTIANNHFLNRAGVFCVEIGAFTPTLPNPAPSIPVDITVAGNQCTAVQSPVAGGYSFAPTLRTSVTGNIYDANGMHTDIAGIELTYGDGAIVSGNTVRGAGLSLDTQSRTMVSGNLLRTIYVGTSSNFGTHDTSDNIVTGNVFDCSDCRAGGYPGGEHVVYIENNAVGSRVQRTRVENNRLLGNPKTPPDGILIINNASGTADADAAAGTVISNNYFEHLADCIWPGYNSGTFHLMDGNDFSGGCRNPIVDNSAHHAQQGDYQKYSSVSGALTFRAGKRHATTIRSVLAGNVTGVTPAGFAPGDQLVAIFCQPTAGRGLYRVAMGAAFAASPALSSVPGACTATTYVNDGGTFR